MATGGVTPLQPLYLKGNEMRIEHGYKVIRDQGYGRVYCRHYDIHKEAEVAMKLWQREGIENSHQSLINGGEWSIKEAKYEVRENGAKFEI